MKRFAAVLLITILPAAGSADVFLCEQRGGAVVASNEPCPGTPPQARMSSGMTVVGPDDQQDGEAPASLVKTARPAAVPWVVVPGGLLPVDRVNGYVEAGCCRICTTGKACGDSCIDRDLSCEEPSGCACDSF